MSRTTDGKIRVVGLREAFQSILTERPKGVLCFYKRLKSVLKTRPCIFARRAAKPSQMLVSVGTGGVHLAAVRCLNSATALMSTQKLVGHQLVFGFTLTLLS